MHCSPPSRRWFHWPLAAILIGIVLAVASPAAADGSYPPTAPTGCQVVVRASAGHDVVVRVDVAANDLEGVDGSVTVAISTARPGGRRAVRGARQDVLWTTTVRYRGTPIEVSGPRLPRGRYRATIVFVPDDGLYEGCRAATTFSIGDRPQVDDQDHTGALPETGGPSRWAVVVGLGLIGAGAPLAGVARTGRRRARASRPRTRRRGYYSAW